MLELFTQPPVSVSDVDVRRLLLSIPKYLLAACALAASREVP